jgi:hypothetical protein
MEEAHANAIAGASSGLEQAAIGLGAEVIALVEADASKITVTYFWRRSGDNVPERRSFNARFPADGRLLSESASGKAVFGTATARVLREAISEQAQSFLLFPLQGFQKAVTGVIGFTEANPPVLQVPDEVVENLSLLGWVAWSTREIARLRGELKTVNEQLAGRKLVERAKSTLQAERRISEEQAYEYLRSTSRRRRITLAELSAEILGGRAGRNPGYLPRRQPESAS